MIGRRADVRIPADPQDFETTQDRTALPPIEFKVSKSTTATMFAITDRQFPAERGPTSSYRVYFLPAAFSPTSAGTTATVPPPPTTNTDMRIAGQRVASLVTEVSTTGRGDVLTATDTQFFGKPGWYYCVGVNARGVEAPVEHYVKAP